MRSVATWVGRALGAVFTLALAAVIVLGLFGLGYSGRVGDAFVDLSDVNRPRAYDLVVTSVVGSSVTLEGGEGEDLTRDGRWGLAYPGGYGEVGEVLSVAGDAVIRAFSKASGEDPVTGSVARLDASVWSGGAEAAGLASRAVTYTTELGEYPSWLVGPSSDTWLIVVHHKGAELEEGLRMAAAAADAGFSTLIISYRHDRDAPPAPQAAYTWGETEWRDLEGAVRLATSSGATTVVVAGYGMGGSMVLSFLDKSELAGDVAAAVLDSPIIDVEAAVAHDLAQQKLGAVFDLPTAFNESARLIAGWRFDLDWPALDYGEVAAAVPTLIFHGDTDAVAPLSESEAYAAANRGLVRLVVTEDAGFTESWNVDPEAYRTALVGFLSEL